MSQKVRKNRELVQCDYCDKCLNKDNLSYHVQHIHPGKHPRVKGDPKSVSEFFGKKEPATGFKISKPSIQQQLNKGHVSRDDASKKYKLPCVPNYPQLNLTKETKTESPATPLTRTKLPSLPPSFLKKYTHQPDMPAQKQETMQPLAFTKVKLKDCEGSNVAKQLDEVTAVFKQLRSKSDIRNIRTITATTKSMIEDFEKACEDAELPFYDGQKISHTFESALNSEIRSHYQVIRTKSDGNCYFRALSQSLFGEEDYGEILRLQMVDHILKEEESLRSIETAFATKYDDLLTTTKTLALAGNEGWATEFNIFISSEVLKRPIVIHQPGSTPKSKGYTLKYCSDPTTANKKPITIMCMDRHFQPLLPLTADSSINARNLAYPNIAHKYLNKSDPNNPKQVDITDEELQDLKEVQRDMYEVIQLENKDNVERTSTQEDKDKSSVRSRSPVKKCRDEIKAEVDINNERVDLESQMDVTSSDFMSESSSSSAGLTSRSAKKLNDKVNIITVMLKDLLKMQRPFSQTAFEDVLVLDKTFFEAKSIQDIITKCPFVKPRLNPYVADASDEFTELVCELCHDDLLDSPVGKFTYHSCFGTDFSNKPQPEAFRNLKKIISKHMESQTHTVKLEETRSDSKLELKEMEKNYQAGVLCGRMAYTSIKSDRSISKYEEHIALLSSLNMPVGNLNHSRKFCREFGHSIQFCLNNRLISYLVEPLKSTGRPTPIAFIADKYTPNRITGQVVGIRAFVDGKFRDINIGFPKLANPSSIGIAENLHETLLKYYTETELKCRLVGGCTDGEYIQKRVNVNFLSHHCLDVAEEAKEWYSWDWDKAHIIELAFNEANKVDYFSKIDTSVHTVNKKYTHGKSFAQMQQVGEESGVKFRVPLQGSQTRFAAYAHKVLENFVENYEFYYDSMKSANDSDLKTIDNTEFVLAVNLKLDIMKRISVLSKECQKTDVFSWRMYRYAEETFDELRRMSNSIDTDDIHEKLPTFKQSLNELSGRSTFLGKPVVQRKPHHSTRSSVEGLDSLEATIHHAKLQCEKFTDTLVLGYNNRVFGNKPTVYNLMEQSFKLENVVNVKNVASVPNEFEEYFKLSQASGYLPADLDVDNVKDQYVRMCSIITQLVEGDRKFHPTDMDKKPWDVEARVYNLLFKEKSQSKISDAVDLLLSACVRTQSEAPCESMGSYIKHISEYRPVDHRNVEEEMFISYNGPPHYSKESEKLVVDAMNRHFHGNKWHFCKKEQRVGGIDKFLTSKVVSRKAEENESDIKIPYK